MKKDRKMIKTAKNEKSGNFCQNSVINRVNDVINNPLKNIVIVAKSIETSRRRDELNFSHIIIL